jgi:hypothetical protein
MKKMTYDEALDQVLDILMNHMDRSLWDMELNLDYELGNLKKIPTQWKFHKIRLKEHLGTGINVIFESQKKNLVLSDLNLFPIALATAEPKGTQVHFHVFPNYLKLKIGHMEKHKLGKIHSGTDPKDNKESPTTICDKLLTSEDATYGEWT